MNTTTNAAPAAPAQKPAPITDANNIAPVINAPKPTVSPEIWAKYLAAVTAGEPTKNKEKNKDGKMVYTTPILPARLSAYALTDEQRKALTAARRDYRHACMKIKHDAQKFIGRKTTHLIAWRKGKTTHALRVADEKAFKSPDHWQAFRDFRKVSEVKAEKAKK